MRQFSGRNQWQEVTVQCLSISKMVNKNKNKTKQTAEKGYIKKDPQSRGDLDPIYKMPSTCIWQIIYTREEESYFWEHDSKNWKAITMLLSLPSFY